MTASRGVAPHNERSPQSEGRAKSRPSARSFAGAGARSPGLASQRNRVDDHRVLAVEVEHADLEQGAVGGWPVSMLSSSCGPRRCTGFTAVYGVTINRVTRHRNVCLRRWSPRIWRGPRPSRARAATAQAARPKRTTMAPTGSPFTLRDRSVRIGAAVTVSIGGGSRAFAHARILITLAKRAVAREAQAVEITPQRLPKISDRPLDMTFIAGLAVSIGARDLRRARRGRDQREPFRLAVATGEVWGSSPRAEQAHRRRRTLS